MLQLDTKAARLWDEEHECFINVKASRVQLEHSLISISKWESIYEKPFPGLNKKELTGEELVQYVKCMMVTPNVDPNLCYLLATTSTVNQIEEYMNRKMTATFFSDEDDKVNKKKKKIITSELVYYWMIAAGIPLECEKWHINRLFTLINICGEENKTGKSKKSDMQYIYARNRKLNEYNRKRFKSKG